MAQRTTKVKAVTLSNVVLIIVNSPFDKFGNQDCDNPQGQRFGE